MTTTSPLGPAAAESSFSQAGAVLDGIRAQDFAGLGRVLAPQVRLRAMLPSGPHEWTGSDRIAGQFARWFGDTAHFDLVEAAVGEVGGRIHLRWRLRLCADRLGPGAFVVEQQVYLDADQDGLITGLDLLCSGYRREGCDA